MTDARRLVGSLYSAVVPGTWVDIPLHDERDLERTALAVIRRQIGRDDRRASLRRLLKNELLGTAHGARDVGAFGLLLSLELLPGLPFPASIVLSSDAAIAVPHEAERGTALERMLAERYPSSVSVPYAAGAAVRAHRLEERDHEGERSQTLVIDYRLAGTASRITRAHVNAPMVRLPELYLEFFDSVMETLLIHDVIVREQAESARSAEVNA